MPRLRFAGQITGCEGYVESAAVGLMAGRFAAAERLGRPLRPLPATTALGALINHITGGHIETIDEGPRSFQPMNVNFGLFPPLERTPKAADGKRLRGPAKALARKRALTDRARADLGVWLFRQRDPGCGGRVGIVRSRPRRVRRERGGRPVHRRSMRRLPARARAPSIRRQGGRSTAVRNGS